MLADLVRGRSLGRALPVVDAENRVTGMVHLHDLMRAGAV